MAKNNEETMEEKVEEVVEETTEETKTEATEELNEEETVAEDKKDPRKGQQQKKEIDRPSQFGRRAKKHKRTSKVSQKDLKRKKKCGTITSRPEKGILQG